MHYRPDIVLYEEMGDVYSVDFSPEGSLLASVHSNDSIHISYPLIKEDLWSFDDYKALLVRFSPDSRFVVAGGWQEKLGVWDVGTGELREIPTGDNRLIDFNPLSNLLAVLESNGSCALWDLEVDEQVESIEFYGEWVQDFGFSSDGTLLAVTQGKEVNIWDAMRWGLLRAFSGHETLVRTATFSPGSRYVCSGDEGGTLIVWDVHTLRTVWTSPPKGTGVRSLAFDHTGDRLAVAYDNQLLEILDPHSGKIEITLFLPHEIFELTFSNVDHCLAVAGKNSLQVWCDGSEIVTSDKLSGATAEGWIKSRYAGQV